MAVQKHLNCLRCPFVVVCTVRLSSFFLRHKALLCKENVLADLALRVPVKPGRPYQLRGGFILVSELFRSCFVSVSCLFEEVRLNAMFLGGG